MMQGRISGGRFQQYLVVKSHYSSGSQPSQTRRTPMLLSNADALC